MEHTGFPSDETLAAFIDGRLDPETRGKVIAHMATCSECYSVFISATEMTATAAPPNTSPRSSRSAWLAVAVTAVAAAFAIVFLVTPVRDLVLPNRGMAALVKAAPAQRTIAGRISGFPYQPMVHVTRGLNYDPMKDPENANLLTAAAGVQRLATERRSAANLHALGVTYLLLGNADAAINTLHEALMDEAGQRTVSAAIEESNDVPLLNDLSAALSHRAVMHKNVTDAAEAVRCADRAWRIGGTQEAAWNRAIAAEALNGPKSATVAWNDYLALDPSSPWAAEARKKLAPVS
jgi:Putative zinc-finger